MAEREAAGARSSMARLGATREIRARSRVAGWAAGRVFRNNDPDVLRRRCGDGVRVAGDRKHLSSCSSSDGFVLANAPRFLLSERCG